MFASHAHIFISVFSSSPEWPLWLNMLQILSKQQLCQLVWQICISHSSTSHRWSHTISKSQKTGVYLPLHYALTTFSSVCFQSCSWCDGDIGLEVHGYLSSTPGGRGISLAGLGPVPLPGSPKKTAETILVVSSDSPVQTLLCPPAPATSLLLPASLSQTSFCSYRRQRPKTDKGLAVYL